jgi:hypothetical protein
MKLVVKFNVVLLVVFAISLAGVAYFVRGPLQQQVRSEVLENAKIMMESAIASRTYTVKQIAPLLGTQMKYQFLAQSVPAYAATEVFNELHQRFPDYGYKEAALNPTNPRDRATDWEADVINIFRQTPDRPEVVGERDTPTGRAMYVARPLQIKNEACLVCHSTVENAPKTMIDVYGNANGFGWKLNEVIGAQVVSVHMTAAEQRAEHAFRLIMISLVAVFIVLFVVLNLMLQFMVIRPMARATTDANRSHG